MRTVGADWMSPDRLISAAESEDEIGAVLRIHLAVDAILESYLEQRIGTDLKAYVNMPRYTGQRISLAAAFGLPLPILAACAELNSIRNGLAHKTEALSESSIQRLVSQVDKLAEINPEFVATRERYLELPVKYPGKRFSLGQGGARIDFLLASFGLISEFSRWMVAQGFAASV